MHIKLLQWQEVLPIRHKVLWPNKPPSFCKVDGDETALHYGVYIEKKLVCVASIFVEDITSDGIEMSARLRKFATLEQYQGQGIGTALITHVICELRKRLVKQFWCDARTTAVKFYHKFNMVKQGCEFQKSGVYYYKMMTNFT